MTTTFADIKETESRETATRSKLLRAGPRAVQDNWLAETQKVAWREFEAFPMPVRTDETWRFSNLRAINLEPYTLPLPIGSAAREELLARSRTLDGVAGRMVFANDQLLTQERYADALRQKGIIWLPLECAAREHPELFRKYFMREEALLGGRKFAALHRSQARAGTFLYVPREVEIELPVESLHWLHGNGGSCFPHTLIVAEEMSKVTVLDRFQSADAAAPGLACGVNDLWLGSGAKVTYICAQRWSSTALAFQINSTVVGRDAHALALNLNLGGAYARTESISHLRGEGGRSDMLAASVAEDSQEMDQRTFQVHEVPHTASDLLYKNALDDRARTVFSGLIRVNPGAHKTDAYQKVRNLLLSDDAEANSAPGLEIEADDVRCTHGATSGQIDEEELFYLRSRGITKARAQQLIVQGFLQEVIDRLGENTVATMLGRWMREKLNGPASLTSSPP